MKSYKEIILESLQSPWKNKSKFVKIVNGYPIHDGEKNITKEKRFLIFSPDYSILESAAPTLKEAEQKANSFKPGKIKDKKTQDQIDKEDWLEKRRNDISTGAVRRGVRGY